MVIAISPILLIPVGVLTAPDAGATLLQDYAYLRTLDVFDVHYSNQPAVIELGHSVCDGFDAGLGLVDVGVAIVSGAQGLWTVADAGHIIGAAIGSYCIEHSDLIVDAPVSPVSGGVGKRLI